MNLIGKKFGRNERCHCGSGKKYKHCHLDADRQSELGASQPPPERPASITAENLEKLPALLELLSEKGPAKDRASTVELIAKSKTLLEYMRRHHEIEAAASALNFYRAEFDRLAANEEEYQARTRALFAEVCFAPLRFEAADIKRAFDHVGYPAMASKEKTVETLRAAILWLGDKPCRADLAMELYLRLPGLVAAGRFLDGWLLQDCAYSTSENAGESNPFLFEMFSYGYDAWEAEKLARDESLLRNLGLPSSRAQGMDAEELEAWVREQSNDPAGNAVLEAFFRDHPELHSVAVANAKAMEHDCVEILKRPDARSFLLAPDEIESWIPAMAECCEKAQPEAANTTKDSPIQGPLSEAAQNAFFFFPAKNGSIDLHA